MFSQAIAKTFTVFDQNKTYLGTTLSNGNKTLVTSAGGGGSGTILGPQGGQYFAEITVNTWGSGIGIHIGLWSFSTNIGIAPNFLGSSAGDYAYNASGSKVTGGASSAYGSTFTNGDIIGVAYDATGGTVTFYKNGISQGQAFSGIAAHLYLAVSSDVGGAAVGVTANFGASPFTYSVPTGYQPGWFS